MNTRQLAEIFDKIEGPAHPHFRQPHVDALRGYIVELHERIQAFGRAEALWHEQLEQARRERDAAVAELAAERGRVRGHERDALRAVNQEQVLRASLPVVGYARPYPRTSKGGM